MKNTNNKIKNQNMIKNTITMFFVLCLFLMFNITNVYAGQFNTPMGGVPNESAEWLTDVQSSTPLQDGSWISSNSNYKQTANYKQAQCMTFTKEQKEKINIAQYKEYIAQVYHNHDYKVGQNSDYIQNRYGEKYYAWVIRDCLVGYDMPSPIHFTSSYTTLASSDNSSFSYGTLVYLHRSPIYDLTLFVPSRYQWWYVGDPTNEYKYDTMDSGSDDFVPSYAQLLNSSIQGLNNLGYTEAIVDMINNNISYYAPKFVLTYSNVPHILGTEGLSKPGTYIGDGAVYALMDEVNGMSVPVYINHSAEEGGAISGLTPLWSFTSPHLPGNSKHIKGTTAENTVDFSTQNKDYGLWWKFEIEEGKEGYTWLSSIINLDRSCSDPSIPKSSYEHAYYGDKANGDSSMCATTGTVYGATEHEFVLTNGLTMGLGYRDKLDRAIIDMGGPLLVGSIDLAMDEALLQRNASVNFMQAMQGNRVMDYGNGVKDAGFAWNTDPALEIPLGSGRADRGYIQNFNKITDLHTNELSYLNGPSSSPVEFIASEYQRLSKLDPALSYLAELSNSQSIASTVQRKAFLSTAIGYYDYDVNRITIGGFRTAGITTRMESRNGANFKTGNLTFIRNLGFRDNVFDGVTPDNTNLSDSAKIYGQNLGYSRMPGKVYSSAIVSIPTVIDIEERYYSDENVISGEKTGRTLYYPGFYNFYKNDEYTIKLLNAAGSDATERKSALNKATTNNKLINITYGYHSFYSFGRYGLEWNWNDVNAAHTLPNENNLPDPNALPYFSTEKQAEEAFSTAGAKSEDVFGIYDYSLFYSSEKDDDWGVWRNQGYLLSGNTWLTGSFPADLDEYKNTLSLNDISRAARTIRYPWRDRSGYFYSGYQYSKLFLEFYYAKTFYPENMENSLKENRQIYSSLKSQHGSDLVLIKDWENTYNQTLDTMKNYILTDPLYLNIFSRLAERTAKINYYNSVDSKSGYITTTSTETKPSYFQARSYRMTLDGNVPEGRDNIVWAMKEKVYSFENEMCKRLTMRDTDINGGCSFDANYVAEDIEGYGRKCIHKDFAGAKDWQQNFTNSNCKLTPHSLHKNSHSAFLEAASQSYPNSKTTYLEDLTYLFVSYFSLNELSSDFTIASAIKYHDANNTGTDVSTSYMNSAAISGDFSNVILLNHDTRLNSYFCSNKINNGSPCTELNSTSFIKTSEEDGSEVTVPRDGNKLSKDKLNASTNKYGDYGKRYGPELYLINELTGQYTTTETDTVTCRAPWKQVTGNDLNGITLSDSQILCRKTEATQIVINCPRDGKYQYDAESDTCIENGNISMECETGFRPFLDKCIKTDGTVIGCEKAGQIYNEEMGLCIDRSESYCSVDFDLEDYDFKQGLCFNEQEKDSCIYGGEIIDNKCVVPIPKFTGVEEDENVQIINFAKNLQTVTLDKGIYKIEAWGASGGNSGSGRGGAYATGTIELDDTTTLYINTGGTTTTSTGGYNGGGSGTHSSKDVSYEINGKTYNILGYGGGGATDVRLSENIRSRILVAAGGGGSASVTITDNETSEATRYTLLGGTGGDYLGSSGDYEYEDPFSAVFFGNGGAIAENGKNQIFTAQTDPITVNYNFKGLTKTYQLPSETTALKINGTDTVGGSTYDYSDGTNTYRSLFPVAGGGGGYRTGAAGLAGAGGSSFVYAQDNGEELSYSYFQTEYTKNRDYLNSKYAMYNTQLISSAGLLEMPLPNGSTGSSYKGNGKVKITRIDTASNIEETCEYLLYEEVQVYNSETGQEEIEKRSRHNTHTAKLMEMHIGSTELFTYAAQAQEYVVPIKGKYLIEAWGAQGGSSSSGTLGGKGGYSTTVLDLNANDKLYLYVGGQGRTGSMTSEVSGGFNGGGKASAGGGGSGGGASDVRLYEDLLSNRVIVAGGGGGGGLDITHTGGYGGGSIAGTGASSFYPEATSINGYVPSGQNIVDEYGTPIAAKTNEGAPNIYAGGGAGGGGFYGGYSGFTYGGGGGSGYVDANNPKAYMLDGNSIFYSTESEVLEYIPDDELLDPSISVDQYLMSVSLDGLMIGGNDFASVVEESGNRTIYIKTSFINTPVKGCQFQDTLGCSIQELRNRGFRVDYLIENEINISINIIEPATSLSGDGTYEHGHSGNGAIRITAIELYDGSWQANDASYQGSLSGDKPKVPNTTARDTTVLIKETVTVNEVFEFTGSEQQITLQPGTYTFQLYGASGGKGYNNDDSSLGLGGYTEGTLTIDKPTKFYLYVGGKGEDGSSKLAKGGWTAGGNGWNIYAGAGGWTINQSYGGGGGGGATIISTSPLSVQEITPPTGTFAYAYRSASQCDYRNSLFCSNATKYNGYHSTTHTDWSKYEQDDRKFYQITNTDSIYLVAGGGGGSPAVNSKIHLSNYKGGAGGGATLLGTDGVGYKWDSTGRYVSTYSKTGGKAGTASAGGAAGQNSSNKSENGTTSGSLIFGGDGASGIPTGNGSNVANSAYGSGGGGAGYYGGGGGSYHSLSSSSSYSAGGGGGSGYVKPGIFSHQVNASDLTQRSSGDFSGITGQNEGNGYIRIKGQQTEGSIKVQQLTKTDMVYETFNYTGNIETITLQPGEYTFSAWGAKGGGASGGYGAFSTSTINITEPTKFKILVGQKGLTSTQGSGSGGGGTFVTTENNVPIVVAGGGGGSGITSNSNITNASGSIYVENTDQESKVSFGGWSSNEHRSAGAGGGFYSNGDFNTTNGKGSGGYAFVNGGKTGYTLTEITGDTIGGFGGGGGTADGQLGGGGGGYTGGTAGHIIDGNMDYSSGSGGSSYFFGQGYSIPGGHSQPTIDGSGHTELGNGSIGYNGYVIIKGMKTAKAGNGESNLASIQNTQVKYQTSNSDIGKTVKVTLEPGTYILETWGAEGGKAEDGTLGGKGGYSTGTLTLSETTDVYVTAGATPNNRTNAGLNGGGSGTLTGGAGGDASDIRIGGDTIYNRIIVAGGGAGGTNRKGTENVVPGAGGGNNYSESMGYSDIYPYGDDINGTPGSSSSPGLNGEFVQNGYQPTFGQGGYSYDTSTASAGGGGGWYGGGAASEYGVAAGGSGFVFTSSTKNTAHNISGWNIAPKYPQLDEEGNPVLDEDGDPIIIYEDAKYYLENASTISGKNSIPVKNNTTTYEIGNSGNGHVKITMRLDTDYLQKKDSIQNIIDAVNKVGYFEAVDFIKEFSYTGAVEKVTLEAGSYYVEAWGAEGGSSKTPEGLYKDGKKGEYSIGVITLEKTTDVYVYVGGAAGDQTNGYKGGYNGGANGSSNLHLQNATHTYWAGGGGGASEVRFAEDNLANRAVVAAGGDGADSQFRIGSNIFGTSIRVKGGYSGGFKSPDVKSFIYSTKQKYTTIEETTDEEGNIIKQLVENYSDTRNIVPEDYALNYKYLLTSARVYKGTEIFNTIHSKEEFEEGHSGNGFVRIQRVRPIIITHPEVKTNDLAKNTEYYQYTGEVQTAILEPGTYIIQSWGSIGGDGREIFDYPGGKGAYSTSTIEVFDRTEINVLVGRAGFAESDYTGAGGGGSFVSTTTGIPLSVAGAGGGAGRTNPHLNDSYKHGQSTELSGKGNISTSLLNLSTKLVPGYGGYTDNASTRFTTGGAGGGFYGDGAASLKNNGYGLGSGARSFIYSGKTGHELDAGTHGGYGGGGGSANEFTGGGGGGYTGGTGGIYNHSLTNEEDYIGLSGAGGGSYHSEYGYSVSGNAEMPSFYVTNFNEEDYSLHDYSKMIGNEHDGIVMITKVTDDMLNEYASEFKENGLLENAHSDTAIKHFVSEYFEQENLPIDFVDYAGKTNDLISNQTGDIELLPGKYLVELWGASTSSSKGAYKAIKLELNETKQFQYWAGKANGSYILNASELKDSRTSTTYLYSLSDDREIGYVGNSTYSGVEEFDHYEIDEFSKMPSPKGGFEIGHEGDGSIKITILSITSDNDKIDLRTGAGYEVTQPENKRTIYFCALYYKGGADVDITHQHETQFTKEFSYSGEVKSVELPVGAYKLELWGGQGGDAYAEGKLGNVRTGGKGGYASAYLMVEDNPITIYAAVGPKGTYGTYKSATFNGGGATTNTCNSCSDPIPATGGGASHFALVPGEMKDFKTGNIKKNGKYTGKYEKDYSSLILLVAGGGGGRSHSNGGGIANAAFDPDTMICENEVYTSDSGYSWNNKNTNGVKSFQFGLGGTGISHGGGGGGGFCAAHGESSCGGSGYGGYGYVSDYDYRSSYAKGETINVNGQNVSYPKIEIQDGIVLSGGDTFLDKTGLNNEEGHIGNGYAKISGVKYTYTNEHFHVAIDTFIEYKDAAYSYDLTCAQGYTFNPETQQCEKKEIIRCDLADTGAIYSTTDEYCIKTNNDINCTNGAKPTLVDNKYVCAFFKTPVCPSDGYTAVEGRCQLTNPNRAEPQKCYGEFKLNTTDITLGNNDGTTTTYNPGTICVRTIDQTVDVLNNNTYDPTKAIPLENEDAIILLDNIYSFRNYITYKPSHIRGAFFLNTTVTGPNGELYTGEPLTPQVSTEIWLSTGTMKESYCQLSKDENQRCLPDEYSKLPTDGVSVAINPGWLIPSGTDNGILESKDLNSETDPANMVDEKGNVTSVSNDKSIVFRNQDIKFATDPNYDYSHILSSRVWASFANSKNKIYSSLDFKEKYIMVDFIFKITKEGFYMSNRKSNAIPKMTAGETVDEAEWTWEHQLTWTMLADTGLRQKLGENFNKFFEEKDGQVLLRIFGDDETGEYRQLINTIMFKSSISSFKLLTKENADVFGEWLYQKTGSTLFKDDYVFKDNIKIENDNYIFNNSLISNTEITNISSNSERKIVSFLTGDTDLLDNTSLYVTQISESSSDIFIDRIELLTKGKTGTESVIYAFEAMTEERCGIAEKNQYTQVALTDVYQEHPTETKMCKIYDFEADPLPLDTNANYRFKVYTLWDRLSYEKDHPEQDTEYIDIKSYGNSGAFSFAEPLTKTSNPTMEIRSKSNVESPEKEGEFIITANEAVEFSTENILKHFYNKDENDIKNRINRFYIDDINTGTVINDLSIEHADASPLLLPLSKVNNPKYRNPDTDLEMTQLISDGYVSFVISSKNKIINKLTVWDKLTVHYTLNVCKVDNKVEIVTKCLKYKCNGEDNCIGEYGSYQEIPTIKNGCFIIRTDESVNALDRYIVNQQYPCKVYAEISRVSGNDCETTGNVAWSTNDNRQDDLHVNGNWYEVRNYCKVENTPYNTCKIESWFQYDFDDPGYTTEADTKATDPAYTPYVLINAGDKNPEDSIFIRNLDGAKSYYQVELNYGTNINGNYYDTNLANNQADACWSFASINYRVKDLIVSPTRINLRNGTETIRFTGSYNIERLIDLKQNNRDIPVNFILYGPNPNGNGQREICRIDNAAEITGDSFDQDGNPIDKVASTSKTVFFNQPQSDKEVSQRYQYQFDCDINLGNYKDGDQYILYVEINGGTDEVVPDTTRRIFEEAMYTDNETTAFGIFKDTGCPPGDPNCDIEKCITPNGDPNTSCANMNQWRLIYDFVYESDRQIDEYHTDTEVYMSWVDYDVLNKSVVKEESMVGGTDAENGGYYTNVPGSGQKGWRADATTSELNHASATGADSAGNYISGGFNAADDKVNNKPISANGNEVRAPYNYLAYYDHDTYATGDNSKGGYAKLNLCTDYRVNNTECWRYERNVYHTITYYSRTNARTSTYPTYTTLTSESSRTSSGSWLPQSNSNGNSSCATNTTEFHSTKALNYGTNIRNNYGASGTTEYEASSGSSHYYANSTCLTKGETNPEDKTDLGYVTTDGRNDTENSKCDSSFRVCHGYNSSPNAQQCPTATDWWGNTICASTSRIYSDEPDSGNHPGDFINHANFGNPATTGSNQQGTNGTGGYVINDYQNRSTTTGTNRVILQQTRTQGSDNKGWIELRSQEVCTAKAYSEISYSCPSGYTYGTYGKTGTTSISSDNAGVSTRVYYCNNNTCNDNATPMTSSRGYNTNDVHDNLNMSDHTYMVCNNEGSFRPSSSTTEPIGYGDRTRYCYWISDQYTPGSEGTTSQDFIWWNTSPQKCFREHRDWTCQSSIGGSTSLSSSSTITNSSGNSYGGTCKWEGDIDWEDYECSVPCNCDQYGCDSCPATGWRASCPTVNGLSGSAVGDTSPGCDNGTSDAYCVYTYSVPNTRDGVSASEYSSGRYPVTDYMEVDCSSGDDTEDFVGNGGNLAPLCYQKTNENAVSKGDQRCIRWKTHQYKEIKYYTTATPKLVFNTRNYGETLAGAVNNVKMKQYSCNRRLIENGAGDKYPDQQAPKDYTEAFSTQLYIKTERSGGWISIPDGGNVSPDLVPRAGEYFDIKAISIYTTTRGQKPSPMPFLSEYYNNYHNDNTFNTNAEQQKHDDGLFPTRNTASDPYTHWGQCSDVSCKSTSTSIQDLVNNEDYGYCDAKVAEPYGCSYTSADSTQFESIGDRNDNNDLQGQNGILWESNKNPTNGYCYYGPDNWINLARSRAMEYDGKYSDDISAQLLVTRSTASADDEMAYLRDLVPAGGCKSWSYSLCTEYETQWTTRPVTAANGTVINGFYVEVDDSRAPWKIEFIHTWFDGVAKFEQTLLGDSGPDAFWGYNGENGKYFNLINEKPIYPLCDCATLQFQNKGEVAWASSEWEVE